VDAGNRLLPSRLIGWTVPALGFRAAPVASDSSSLSAATSAAASWERDGVASPAVGEVRSMDLFFSRLDGDVWRDRLE
jgi:hypothetical protein